MSKPCLSFVAFAALLTFLLGATGAVCPLRAAEPSTLIVVFDGSGSMWGKSDGERQSKLVLARDGVRQGLGRLAGGTKVGLMSFGHRRGGDCQDTEMILEPAPIDAERIMTSLEKLNPRGRGPITKALREAAGKLGPGSAAATVILVHDGADNCQQDPCAAVGELRAAHPQVRVDVVSISVAADEAATVACLPKATGGKHYQVSAARDIDAALVEAIARAGGAAPPAAEARSATQAPAPAPGPNVATNRPGLQLWTALVRGGPALAVPAHWTIRRIGDKGAPLWEGDTAAPLLLLPTGRYEVTVRAGLITKTAIAEAVEGQPRALGIVLDGGTLAFAQSPQGKAMLEDSVVSLARLEAKGAGEPLMLRQVDAEMALPAGNYLVGVTAGALRIERPVGIFAGDRVSIANALSLGELELSAVAVKDGPPLKDLVYSIFEDDPDAPQGRREVVRSAASMPRLKLTAGTYYVVARRGAAETRDRVTVRAGEVERRVLMIETGQVQLALRIAGNRLETEGPIVHRLERIDVQPPELVTASGPTASLDVAAGQYRLDSRLGLGNVRLIKEFRLKPGESERINVDLPAGAVRFRYLEPTSGRALPDMSFEVRDRAGQVVWAALGSEPKALLLAGRYTLRIEGRGVSGERAFDVAAGEDRMIELAGK